MAQLEHLDPGEPPVPMAQLEHLVVVVYLGEQQNLLSNSQLLPQLETVLPVN
jgi:hypothetical protein